MFMVSFSTPTYDLDGVVLFHAGPRSELKTNDRRVTRTPTLDGGCEILDQGFSDSDRTLVIKRLRTPKDLEDALWYLFRTYGELNVSIQEGVFSGAIKSISVIEGELTLRFLVKDKLSA